MAEELKYDVVTDGLFFPEGPVWMKDGSVIVMELGHGRVTRVLPDGTKITVAEPGGSPNGAAVGPDGALYVCNNGGMNFFIENGIAMSDGMAAQGYTSGRLERIDLESGQVTCLYDRVDGRALAGPNDIVFDAKGGFWFSDLGMRHGHRRDDGGLFYAHADGSLIKRVIDRIDANGVGISADGKTLYVALTYDRLLLAFDIVGEGEVAESPMLPGRVVGVFGPRQWPDSLALTADGLVCVGTNLEDPGISVVDPKTGDIARRASPDFMTTNICFGGPDMQDAWVTLSSVGQLVKVRWDRPGMRLPFNA